MKYYDVRTQITPAYVSISHVKKGGRSVLITRDHVGLYKDGAPQIIMDSKEHGGLVIAAGKDGGEAVMKVGEHGGRVEAHGNGSSKGQAVMAVSEYGNGVVNTWDKNGYRVATLK